MREPTSQTPRPADRVVNDAGERDPWDPGSPGVLRLPSGRVVRGRGLRGEFPDGPDPHFGLYLAARPPVTIDWKLRWVPWRALLLPSDHGMLSDALYEAWVRAGRQRVELACPGGRTRTGTALACLSVLDGIPADDAVAFVRARYDRRAVPTPWHRRFVADFERSLPVR